MKKYFTLSYDDGVEQDKTIISLLRKYSIPATFNLNSGLFSDVRYLKYSGVDSLCIVPKDKVSHESSSDILEIVRISEDEISQVYEGFEIATHTPHHERLTDLTYEQIVSLLNEDRRKLENFSSMPVVGHAFPYGATDERVCTVLKDLGFEYARGGANKSGKGAERFEIPDNRFNFNPTCRHTDEDVLQLLNEFVSIQDSERDIMFYMWGHGYEIDFLAMKDRKFLYTFEKMLDTVACCDEIIKCTNSELFNR